jgi:hypothetical protein
LQVIKSGSLTLPESRGYEHPTLWSHSAKGKSTPRNARDDEFALNLVRPSSNPYPKFLDPEQAAVFLGGLNSRTVTRWAREGYLPAYPIGEGKRRLWRFLEHDLEQWMLARRTGTLTTAADALTGGFVQ